MWFKSSFLNFHVILGMCPKAASSQSGLTRFRCVTAALHGFGDSLSSVPGLQYVLGNASHILVIERLNVNISWSVSAYFFTYERSWL